MFFVIAVMTMSSEIAVRLFVCGGGVMERTDIDIVVFGMGALEMRALETGALETGALEMGAMETGACKTLVACGGNNGPSRFSPRQIVFRQRNSQ